MFFFLFVNQFQLPGVKKYGADRNGWNIFRPWLFLIDKGE